MRLTVGALASAAAALAAAGCGGGGAGKGSVVSPSPGAPAVSPQTQISFRGVTAKQIHDLTVTGSVSGRHEGAIRSYDNVEGASFVPTRPFAAGEKVHVRARLGERGTIDTRFTVARPPPAGSEPAAGTPPSAGGSGKALSFRTLPDIHPPPLRVTRRADQASGGYLFTAPTMGPAQLGSMISDDRGRLVWFRPAPAGQMAFDFRVQQYQGRPVLTWWQGSIVPKRGYGHGVGIVADSSYRPIATFHAGNGVDSDLHEFLISPQGTILITAYEPVAFDLSSVGGRKAGVVEDSVVQEIDPKTGLVILEWDALGHVGLDESYAPVPKDRSPYDFFHVNSVAVDRDGNLLVSARNTWTVYKIDRRTGAIMWRFGGKKSDFSIPRDGRFAWQHDARRQADGTLTLFNNAAAPKVQPQSRGLVFELGANGGSVKLVRAYSHRPHAVLATSQGNVQVLPDGNVMVGWGADRHLSEFARDGSEILDATFPVGNESYRAYRFPWTADPPGHPAVAAAKAGAGRIEVYASWNGATAIARWEVLAGTSPGALKQVASAPWNGLETAIPVRTSEPVVAVRAISASGATLGTSGTVSPR